MKDNMRFAEVIGLSILISSNFMNVSVAKADPSTAALLERLEKLEKRTQSLEEENLILRSRLESSVPQKVSKINATNYEIDKKPKISSYRSLSRDEHTIIENRNINDKEIYNVSKWNGLYFGINAGYAVNNINDYSSVRSATNMVYATGYSQYSGPLVGAQVGYNYAFANKIILGLEADMDWADVNNSARNAPASNKVFQSLTTVSGSSTGIDINDGRSGLDWLGTVRARLGYDLGMFMPFVSGGFAYGGLSASGQSISGSSGSSSISAITLTSGSLAGGSFSTVSTGWALGGGFEYLVAENWSLKGEYLFTQLHGLSGYGVSIAGANLNNNGTISTSKEAAYVGSNQGAFGIHQARIGLNYHTSWLNGGTSAFITK